MMSGIKPITFYFKVKSKDELEVEELLHTQLSRHSNNKASSLVVESSRTISTVSAVVMSIITLVDLTTNNDSYSAGGLKPYYLYVYCTTLILMTMMLYVDDE